mmetsp:Transcript_20994/g.47495  ORF Transcript_20994/g.47495 Transcript_20994/m.47495 type:complete len:259 (+) Transcript_20994:788-1564(+)
MGHPGEPRPEQGLPRRPRRHHRDGHLSLPPPHGTGVAALSLLCLPDMEVRVRVFDDHQHLFFQLLGVSRLWSAGDDNRADVRAGFVSDHQQHRDTPLHGLHDEGLVRDTPRHPAGRGPRGFLERAGKRSLREKDGKRRRRQRRRRRRLLRRRQRVLWHPQQRRRRRRRRRQQICPPSPWQCRQHSRRKQRRFVSPEQPDGFDRGIHDSQYRSKQLHTGDPAIEYQHPRTTAGELPDVGLVATTTIRRRTRDNPDGAVG